MDRQTEWIEATNREAEQLEERRQAEIERFSDALIAIEQEYAEHLKRRRQYWPRAAANAARTSAANACQRAADRTHDYLTIGNPDLA